MERCCPIVELRQYRLHPGARDTLVRIFDEHFVESQERCGMRVIGQFRDLDDPDRFVWLRGFPDMEARTRALEAFYGGPVWKEHSSAANATMVDHTDVLLLKPVGGTAGFRFNPRVRPGPDSPDTRGGIVVATIDHLSGPAASDAVAARSDASEAGVLARLVTEPARNPFVRLPVREDANVIVTFSSYATADAYQPSPIRSPGAHRREHLRLEPTRRSFLRHALLPLPTGERAG
jgi:quinol monooxygenase YgiN